MNRYLVDFYARLQFDCMTLVKSDYMAMASTKHIDLEVGR